MLNQYLILSVSIAKEVEGCAMSALWAELDDDTATDGIYVVASHIQLCGMEI